MYFYSKGKKRKLEREREKLKEVLFYFGISLKGKIFAYFTYLSIKPRNFLCSNSKRKYFV